MDSTLRELWKIQAQQQRELGMDPRHMNEVGRRNASAELVLSLHEEVVELQRITSHYKRHILNEQKADPGNVADEIADIMKLSISLAQLHGLDASKIEQAFHRKTNVVRAKAEGHRMELEAETRVLCCDLDDVLCDLSQWSQQLEMFEGNAPKNGRTLQMMEAYKDEWYKSGRFRELPPIEGAGEALREIASWGWKIVVITARPQWQYKRLYADTLEWLQKHDMPHDLILFNKDKVEAIYEHIAPVWPVAFVEDHERNARHLSAAGVPVLLYDTPKNRHIEDGERLERVKSWPEIIERLKNES